MNETGKQDFDLILYNSPDGQTKVSLRYEEETFWLQQKLISELFGVEVNTVNYHLKEIFASEELRSDSTIRKIRIVQREGNRDVEREIDFYNLDAIIAVGYRVNSYQATLAKGKTQLATSSITELGFVRVLSQPTPYGLVER